MREREGVGTEVEILPDLSFSSPGWINLAQRLLDRGSHLSLSFVSPSLPTDQTLLESIRVLSA